MTRRRVLIIGGTGVFGARLVRHLATRADIEIFVSSRHKTKADDLIEKIQAAAAPLHAVALDTQRNLQAVLGEVRPFAVIDCSGPFQGASYETARQVIQSGAHVIDLADARDYLASFSDALAGEALRHGVCALSGASSTPTLSTCVVDHLVTGWQRVDSIDICITPGGRSEVGRSVIEAIMSYAGKTVPIWTDGELGAAIGWRHGRRIHMPGLGPRRVATVETFDAEALGPRYNVSSRVSFAAGLESRLEQRGIETIAALRARGLLGDLRPLIPALLRARRITRIPTSDTGGMLVDIRGRDAGGAQTQAQWSLVAQQDHGPFVPILPAAAALEKLLAGKVAPQASLAHGILTLKDIERHMNPYPITTQLSVKAADDGGIAPVRAAIA